MQPRHKLVSSHLTRQFNVQEGQADPGPEHEGSGSDVLLSSVLASTLVGGIVLCSATCLCMVAARRRHRKEDEEQEKAPTLAPARTVAAPAHRRTLHV